MRKENPPALRVVSPGVLTTVQDLGRPGWSEIGVIAGGAADALSLRVGNRMVGNPEGHAALEFSLIGGEVEFLADVFAVVSGAEAPVTIRSGDARSPLSMWTPTEIRRGQKLSVGRIQNGARAYLCLAGGVDVPIVLGCRGTHLSAAFGGLEGRALRAGDEIRLGFVAGRAVPEFVALAASDFCRAAISRRRLRGMDGLHADRFSSDTRSRFWSTTYSVDPQSNRAGVRLRCPELAARVDGAMLSEGAMRGGVQIPPGGQPIVLSVDHPTTGGYPIIACVAAVDHAALGQLAPGDTVEFERIDVKAARLLLSELQAELDRIIPRQVT